MYPAVGVAMQSIRNALHRGTIDIHARAAELNLQRPQKPVSTRSRTQAALGSKSTSVARGLHASSRSSQWAADVLRREGYTPVYAQRRSDASLEETGFWVVGARLLSRQELEALADKHKKGRA